MSNVLNPVAVLQRLGVFTQIPDAIARTAGAMHLMRVMAERTPAPVAPSPADVIGSIGAARLLRYRPRGVPLDKAPILLCPSLINRLYVLDLKEGISLVDTLLRAGHPVYGIDWGEPGAAEIGQGIEAHAWRLRDFLVAACTDARVAKMNVLGHCLGGTVATCLAAVDDRHIAGLVLLTTPLQFRDDGVLSAWTRTPFFDPEDLVRVVGHVPAWISQPTFQGLKPIAQTTKAMRLWQQLGNAQFLELFRCLETWINDNVSIPERFFVELVRDLYRGDKLAQGQLAFHVDGVRKPVVLEEVEVPVLALAASEDHIVPPPSAIDPIARMSSPLKRTEVLRGGHIGIVVGSVARRVLWPAILRWLDETEVASDARVTTSTPPQASTAAP